MRTLFFLLICAQLHSQCIQISEVTPSQSFVTSFTITPPDKGISKNQKLAIRSTGTFIVTIVADDSDPLPNGTLVPLSISDGNGVIASASLEVGQPLSNVQNDFNWTADILPYITNPTLVVNGATLLTGLSFGFEKANWAFATDNSYEHGALSGGNWVSVAKVLTWSSGSQSDIMERVVDYIASSCKNINSAVQIHRPLHYDDNGATLPSDLISHTSEYVVHQQNPTIPRTYLNTSISTSANLTGNSWNVATMNYNSQTENSNAGLDTVNIQLSNGMFCINKSRGPNYIFNSLAKYDVSVESQAPNTLDLGSHITRLSANNLMTVDYGGVQTTSLQGASEGFETIAPTSPTINIGERYLGYIAAGTTARMDFQFELNYIY